MGFVSELGFVSKLWATDRKGDSADQISAFSYIFFKDAIVPPSSSSLLVISHPLHIVIVVNVTVVIVIVVIVMGPS